MSSPGPSDSPARTRRQRRRDDLIATSIMPSLRPSAPGGAALWSLGFLAALWLLVLVNDIDAHRLSNQFGITPRGTGHLIGIVTSPLLHASAGQLASNSIPFAVLCWLMLWSGLRAFGAVTVLVWLLGSGVDWLAGPSSANLVGMSGLIFGWMGYILARAVYGRSIKWISIAIVVLLAFFTTFTGLLPHYEHNVFWGGQVASFVVGGLAAAALHRRPGKAKPTASPA